MGHLGEKTTVQDVSGNGAASGTPWALDHVGLGYDTQTNPAPATFRIVKQRHSRYWEVRDPRDELVCITVYKKGAAEVVRRLAA